MFCGIGLATGPIVFRAQADQWDKKTILTVDQTIQVQDTLLRPGTYIFKLMDSSSNRHIVQIFNSDQNHLINTVLAIPNYRLEPTGHSRFMFYETPPGYARAMRAWFYPGDNFGQEFPYPKHLTMLEASVKTTVPEAMIANRETTEITTQPEAPPPAPIKEEEKKVEEKTEIAQAAPPPAPAPPPEAPAAPPPTKLPKTASSYPLIGLSGLVSLALFGLLRLSRSV
jgi:hypothetical protein